MAVDRWEAAERLARAREVWVRDAVRAGREGWCLLVYGIGGLSDMLATGVHHRVVSATFPEGRSRCGLVAQRNRGAYWRAEFLADVRVGLLALPSFQTACRSCLRAKG
jgi:hypothetical protein